MGEAGSWRGLDKRRMAVDGLRYLGTGQEGLTWTNSRVVARSLLSQWPTTLGAVGGGHTETSATLPALPTRGRTHTPC